MNVRALAPLAALGLLACGASGRASPTGAAGTSGASKALPAGLTPADVARKLSLFLWNDLPDDELVQRLYADPPTTTDDVRRIATDMLADPRGREGVRAFFRQWLRLDRLAAAKKDPAAYPEYTPALREAMIAEAEELALHVTFDGDGRLPTLLTADFSMLNETLAPLYGVTGVSGPELRVVPLDRAQRAGVFTLAAVLASGRDSSLPALSSRGAFVMELLGQMPPPQPPGLDGPGPPASGQTMRAALEMAVAGSPSCAGCHALMDPAGVAFGHYDTLGRYQEVENGLPIDAAGDLLGPGVGFHFDGARDFAEKLAATPYIIDTFVARWFEFGSAKIDSEVLLATRAEFVRHDLDIRSLIIAVTASPAFLAP